MKSKCDKEAKIIYLNKGIPENALVLLLNDLLQMGKKLEDENFKN